jgi:group I intron endonuclease
MINNTKIIPVVTYSNIDIDKSKINKDNKGKSGVYRWNNKITNKSCVGSSINLGNRLSTYYSKKAMLAKLKSRTSIIYSALLKHGYDNFTLDILEYCEVNVLIEREQYYFDLLKPEYNILKAANSRIGSKHSSNTKALISFKLKGENHPSFGKRLSQEMRMKLSEINKAFWLKVKIKRKIEPKTPETLLKMSLRCHGVSVKVYDKLNNFVNTFSSITSAAKHFGVSSTTMSRIENKGIYDNFTFKFEPKDFRVWVYNCNKKLVKVFNNNKET